jgi:hypothetical protein
LTGAYYSYWSGVDLPGAELYLSDLGGVLAFPTNDGRVCIAAGRSRDQFPAYRADIEGTFFSILDAAPKLAANCAGSVGALWHRRRLNFFAALQGWAGGDAATERPLYWLASLTPSGRRAPGNGADETPSGRHSAEEAGCIPVEVGRDYD